MSLIFETANFTIESLQMPEIDRLEGGHIKISPKIGVEDRSKLFPTHAIELMRLTIVAGEAMKKGMKKIGVEIGRINYQENGNWKPSLHIHLYCRAKTAIMQKYGDPVIPGHKEAYKPLTNDDIQLVKFEIEKLFHQKRFSDQSWGLK